MSTFRYHALDSSGREVRGEIAAGDRADALAQVRDLGHMPVEVSLAGRSSSSAIARRPGRRRITAADIATLTRQLADLEDAGLPVDRALTVLIEESEKGGLSAVLAQVRDSIREGHSLSEALSAHPRIFSPMVTNMLRAGEASGQLAEVASRLADFLEKEEARRSQLLSAMIYPALIVSVAVLAVALLLTFAIPRLSGVLADLGADLPLPTILLLAAARFLGRYWWGLLAGLAFCWASFRGFAATEAGRTQIDAIMLRLPVTGPVTRLVVMSRFTRALGTMLGGGVPILDALQIAGQAAYNRVTAAAVDTVIDMVRQGQPIAAAMARADHFPPVLRHMAAVGEETGHLPRMLTRVADSMDFRVDNAMRRLLAALEPAVVLATGSFVAFVVLSILLPIFQASTAIK